MKMSQVNRVSLWHALSAAGDLSDRFVFGAEGSIALSDLVAGSTLYGRGEELSGRSVLVMTTSQFTTASAVIELDGIARRIVLCPPDLPLEHLSYVIDTAEVDAIVSDRSMFALGNSRHLIFCPCSREIGPGNYDRKGLKERGHRPVLSRLYGVLSTTSGDTADYRYFFVPRWEGIRWCSRAPANRRPIFSLARASTE